MKTKYIFGLLCLLLTIELCLEACGKDDVNDEQLNVNDTITHVQPTVRDSIESTSDVAEGFYVSQLDSLSRSYFDYNCEITILDENPNLEQIRQIIMKKTDPYNPIRLNLEKCIGIKRIPDSVFWTFKELLSIKLPESVEYIGKHAFYNCYQLRNINLPKNINEIGDSALCDCSDLDSIYISDEITELKSLDLSGCSTLRFIQHIPQSVTSLNLSGCTQLFYSYAPSTINLPQNLISLKLGDCYRLKSLNIPQSLTTLFLYDCYDLESINIPEGLTSLTLVNCPGLRNISIPKSVRGALQISGCLLDETLDIPEGVTSLDLRNCRNMKYLNIPNSVTELLVQDCGTLYSLNIPNKIKYIFRNFEDKEKYEKNYLRGLELNDTYCIFSDCDYLQSITIPESVLYISSASINNYKCNVTLSIASGSNENPTFYYNNVVCPISRILTTVNILQGARTISLENCTKLRTVNISNDVSTLETLNLENCTQLTGDVFLPESIRYLNLNKCDISQMNINFPPQLTKLNLAQCKGVTTLDIPINISHIGSINASWNTWDNWRQREEEDGFECNYIVISGTEITSLFIPKRVEKVGESAFYGCKKLTSLKFETGPTSIDWVTSLNKGTIIYVPNSIVQEFKSRLKNEYSNYKFEVVGF